MAATIDVEQDAEPLLASLQDEWKACTTTAARVVVLGSVPTVALALGTEACHSQLLPFLEECYKTDRDFSILEELAVTYRAILDYLEPSQLSAIIPPLERILQSNWQDAIKKAMETVRAIAEIIKDDQMLENLLLPLFNQMVEKDPFVALCMIPILQLRLSEQGKVTVRKSYQKICLRKTFHIRHKAQMIMREAQPLIKDAAEEFMPILKDWVHDTDSHVQMLSVGAIASVMSCFPYENEEKSNNGVELLRKLASEREWSVRFVVASNIGKIMQVYPSSAFGQDLHEIIIPLFHDLQPGVRKAAVKNLQALVAKLDQDNIQMHIYPVLFDLKNEPETSINIELFGQLDLFADILPPSECEAHIFPMMMALMQRNLMDSAAETIKALDKIYKVIPKESIVEVISVVTVLIRDTNWRMRFVLLDFIRKLIFYMDAEFFLQQLLRTTCMLLQDCTFAVRDGAALLLLDAAKRYGSEWTQSVILPEIKKLAENKSYLGRFNAVVHVAALAPALPDDILCEEINQILLEALQDPVPNIRMSACNALQSVASRIPGIAGSEENVDESLEKTVIKKLSALKRDDADDDVREFAEAALQSIQRGESCEYPFRSLGSLVSKPKPTDVFDGQEMEVLETFI